jgi:uncharacterized Zn finger protein (UPF0148 family)
MDYRPGEDMAACPKCGTINPDGARFCGNCAVPLITTSQVPTQVYPPPTTSYQPTQNQPYQSERIKASSNKEMHKKKPYEAIFVILVAMSSAMGGFCAYMSADASVQANDANIASLMAQNNASAEYNLIYQSVRDDLGKLADSNVHWFYAGYYEEYNDTFNATKEYTIAEYIFQETDFHKIYDIDGTYWNLFNSTNQSDYDAFWVAFRVYKEDAYASYFKMKNESEQMAIESVQFNQQAKSYLISTVLFGISATVSAIGVSIESKYFRLSLLLVTVIIILIAIIHTVMVAI